MTWNAKFRRGVVALTRARERESSHYLLFGTAENFREWRREHPDIPKEQFTHVWAVHHLRGRMGDPRMKFFFLRDFHTMRYKDEITAIVSYYRPVDGR